MPAENTIDKFDPNEAFELEIDLDTFTLGEIAALEKISGLSFGQIGAALQGESTLPMGGLLIALALVSLRRKYPKITQAEVEQIKIVSVLGDGTTVGDTALPPPAVPG
jgi:hypothetical protein